MDTKMKMGYAQVSNYVNLEHDARHYAIEINKAEKEYRKVKVDLIEHFRRKLGGYNMKSLHLL